MKFPHLFKVHQISSNWQNLLESSSEACMWNLSPFGEVKIFHEKMSTVLAIEILWNFEIFSKFTKFHQTDRIYWNHHLKHACEIWVHSEKLKFSWKNANRAGYRNIMKIPYLFKIHQISSNLQNLLESSSETCMWNFQSSPNFIKLTEFTGIIIWNMHVNLSPFREVKIFHWKMPTVLAIEILWKFHTFLKFLKFLKYHENMQT